MRGLAVLLIAAALVAGFLSGQAWQRPAAIQAAAPAAAPMVPAPAAAAAGAPVEPAIPEGLTAEETRNIAVFRRASDSVVFITSIALRRDFFSLDVFKIPQGSGSGFVWDRQGNIVTNFHVIEGGSQASVTLSDQSEWDAEVVGTAPDMDLAVLRIKAPAARLTPLEVGRSANLAVGQTVLAVGNPFGLDHTLTVGVISALGRTIEGFNDRTIRDVIQTDAAINPGNSGGPLLDSHGRLIGVNSQIKSPSGAFAGVGFAIPVDTVSRIVPQLIQRGAPVRAGIGISSLPDYLAARNELEGVVVYDVAPRSPAAAAGIEGIRMSRTGRAMVGDRIVAVDGKPVRTRDDMLHQFEAAGVGASVELTVARGDEKRKVRVKLVELD